ncbi:MAG: aldo/keto reductase [Myxococcota bacterium]
MTLRELGQTGLVVSPIGLGMAGLGRPAYMNRGRDTDFPEGRSVQEMAMRSFSVLDAARARGVRYIDVARSYGQGEGFVADWIQRSNVDPGEVTIGSKWGYTYVGAWRLDAPVHETKSHDIATLDRQWEATRKVLWSHLDLYQVHSVRPDSTLFEDAALLERLHLLREQFGVHLGATVTGPDQASAIRRLMDLHVEGSRLFETVQATYNPLEPSAAPALEEAHRAGMGVIIKESLANGRLAPGRHDPEVASLARAAVEREVPLDALVLALTLEQPWADVALSGAVTCMQLESNLKALTLQPDDEVRRLALALREAPDAYWNARSNLPWN